MASGSGRPAPHPPPPAARGGLRAARGPRRPRGSPRPGRPVPGSGRPDRHGSLPGAVGPARHAGTGRNPAAEGREGCAGRGGSGELGGVNTAAPPTPSSSERCPFRGRAGLPRRARRLRGALPGPAAPVSGVGWGPCRDLGGRGPEAALAGRESRWSGGGGMCAAGRVALLASPSRGAGPAPGHPLGRSDVEKCPWRPGSLSGPGCGLGVGGGGGPGPSPPPLPRRGGPPGAPGLVPAGGGDRAGRGRGKRQLRFQRVCPSASSRCRRTGRCEAWKPVLEGRNRSDSMHSDSVGPGTLGWTWRLDWIRPLRVPSH